MCLHLDLVPYRRIHLLLHKVWCLSLHGVKFADQVCYGPRTLEYLNDYHDIPFFTNFDINWKARRAAAWKLHIGLKCWQTKFSGGWIGLGNQLVHYRHQGDSDCPLRMTHGRKVSHVLHCPENVYSL